MARQYITTGFPAPNYVSETGARQEILPGVLISETSAISSAVEPHFVGRFRQSALFAPLALRANTANDASGPLGVQSETNTHFVARYAPTKYALNLSLSRAAAADAAAAAVVEANGHFVGHYRAATFTASSALRTHHTANDASGPLGVQPETNPYTVGRFAPTYLRRPIIGWDAGQPPVVETNPHFVARFRAQALTAAPSLRSNTANDSSGPLGVQPETNAHVVARYAPTRYTLNLSLLGAPAGDAAAFALVEANGHFAGRYRAAAFTASAALRTHTANDASGPLGVQPETNPHAIGRFAPTFYRRPIVSWDAAQPPVAETNPHVFGAFKPTALVSSIGLRSNTANDASGPLGVQGETNTNFIGRFRAIALNAPLSLRANVAGDVPAAAAVAETSTQFVGRYWPTALRSLSSLRGAAANDASGPLPTQPATNTFFLGRFAPAFYFRLASLRSAPAGDVPPPSAAPLLFPVLPGQGWSVHKKPNFSAIVASHASGREVVNPLWLYPLWDFELTFNGLASDSASYPGLGAQSLQALFGLFLQCRGRLNTFLYTDPTDNAVIGQPVATADGITAAFILPRTLGPFAEPVGFATSVGAVYFDGVAQPGGWSLTAPNIVVFTAPPAAGVAITADFSFAFVCRFTDDIMDFENFMANLWTVQSVKFRSVRTN